MGKRNCAYKYEGSVSKNNFGSIMVLEKWENSNHIKVYFPQYNYHVWSTKNAFDRGNIKCPYEPRLYKVGYTGEGEYKSNENGKYTRAYTRWNAMLRRVYANKEYDCKCYKECEVDEEWWNFQNFARWESENFYQVKGDVMCLDKDLLSEEGRKIYSPETCVYLPKQLNSVLPSNNPKVIAKVLYTYKDLPHWIVELVECKYGL